MDIANNNISFQAKLGNNILKKVNKEFCGDKLRVDKYVQLFEDTFASNIDKETVIDINKYDKLFFSHTAFPNVKYQNNSKVLVKNSFAKTLINECSRTFGGSERDLFKIIIIKYLNKGLGIQKLIQSADKISNPKSKESFFDSIKVAQRLEKEYPNSKITRKEFDYMQNIIMQEEVETPGTKLYELIHNLDSLKFTISQI